MIILEIHNSIIEELLNRQIEAYLKQEKIVVINTKILDFDGIEYHVTHGSTEPFNVSMKMKFYQELEMHGINEILRRIYGDMLIEPKAQYDVTISFDFTSQISLDKTLDSYASIVRKMATLKRNCFAALFERFFQYQKEMNSSKSDSKMSVIHYRQDETLYLKASSDRVVVIFSTIFKDADDNVLGRVFMEIFPERRMQFQQSPQVIVNYRTVPDELKGLPDIRKGDNVGYFTFVLFPRHFDEKMRETTINMVHTFRSYLHYHIKCCKAHIHAHMRRKTAELIRRLQSARPVQKKTGRDSRIVDTGKD